MCLLLKALEIGFDIAEMVSMESDTTMGEAVTLANSLDSAMIREKPREHGSTT